MKNNYLVLLLIFFLASCQAVNAFLPTASVAPTQSLTSTPTSTSTKTSIPTVQFTKTPIFTITPTQSLPMLSLENFRVYDSENSLHNVILFISEEYPFPGLRGGGGFDWLENYHLYAFSPDGSSHGTLNSQESTFDVFRPSDPGQPPRIVFSEFSLPVNEYELVKLPQECDPAFNQFDPCKVQFSTDGKYLGMKYGPESCGQNLMIVNVQTGQVIYKLDTNNGHWLDFIGYGKALIARGHCEGGSISILNLATGALSNLTEEGPWKFNQNRTALFISYGSYLGPDRTFLVYNVQTNEGFEPKSSGWLIADRVEWVDDGQYIIYQLRDFEYPDTSSTVPVFNNPSRIMLMDITNGQEQILASDSGFDFVFCDPQYKDCRQEHNQHGDWFPIRRSAFKACLGDIQFCMHEVSGDVLALNWRTGEIIPWDESKLLPLPIPTDTASVSIGPDLFSKPVYQHPSGEYSFYTGMNGEGIWIVPHTGQPAQWAIHGWGFTYIP